MKLPVPHHKIPPERKWIYYTGMGLMALGLVLFLSTFVTFAMHFGDFDNFAAKARSDFGRAIGGMIGLILGGILMGVGARGFAGSGVMLDPQRAKQDLEPWARMSGALTDAAFAEMPTVRETIREAVGGSSESREVVRVRCRACQALNDEHDKFCGQCGAPL
jgi:hypothetical protein